MHKKKNDNPLVPVPSRFNLPCNRHPLPIDCFSDSTFVRVWFYECDGVYWYSVTVKGYCTLNSVPFFHVQNCISAFRAFLRGYGFKFVDSSLAELRLSGLRRQLPPRSSEV